MDGDVYGGELTEYAVFPSWNHWPVAQMPSDGRYATYPDRTSHSSLTHVKVPTYREDFGKRPFEQRLLLEGMSDSSPAELAKLARSWLQAPQLTVESGAESGDYDPAQRAYRLASTGGDVECMLRASPEKPIFNLCFVIDQWKGTSPVVRVDGKKLPEERVRVGRPGTVRTHDLVVWIELESTTPTKISFSQR